MQTEGIIEWERKDKAVGVLLEVSRPESRDGDDGQRTLHVLSLSLSRFFRIPWPGICAVFCVLPPS
jgi:hypothetical protein